MTRMYLGQFWEVYVTDMAQSIAFYRDVLGFGLVRIRDDFADLELDQVKIHLCPRQDWPLAGPGQQPSRLGEFTEFVLVASDIHAVYERVLRSNWPICEGLQDQPWGKTDFRIIDPDGAYLRITTPRYASNSF